MYKPAASAALQGASEPGALQIQGRGQTNDGPTDKRQVVRASLSGPQHNNKQRSVNMSNSRLREAPMAHSKLTIEQSPSSRSIIRKPAPAGVLGAAASAKPSNQEGTDD